MSEPKNERKDEALSLRESLHYIFRGFKEIHLIDAQLIPLSLLAAFLKSATPLVALYLSAQIINLLTDGAQLSPVLRYAGIAVGISFALACLSAFVERRLETRNESTWLRFYAHLSRRYAALDYRHIEGTSVNELLADIQSKTNGNGLGVMRQIWDMNELMTTGFSVVGALLLLVGMFHTTQAFTPSFLTSNWAVLLLAAAVAIVVCGVLQIQKWQQKREREAFAHNQKGNNTAHYYFDYVDADKAAKDIRLYRQQELLSNIIDENTSLKTWLNLFRIQNRISGVNAALNAVIGGGVYLLIGLRTLVGMYPVGSAVQYIGAASGLVQNITTFASTLASLMSNAVYIKLYYSFMDLPDHHRGGKLPTPDPANSPLEFAFEGVSFRYPGSAEKALDNVTMRFRAGERLAVVGMNGSGKTTMIKLLCRLYAPTEGTITLNGIDVWEYDYDAYMQLFGVVFQDFEIPDLTLGQVVACAENPDEAAICDCLEKAGFTDKRKALPDGISTYVGKGYNKEGVQLSGGEKQKVALARSICKDAQFIILDEPTAALDPMAEYDIYTRFNEIIREKTAVFISHRLSSCRFCQDIAVFHAGRLVQRGNHEDLLGRTGKYQELWNAQAQHYVQENMGG